MKDARRRVAAVDALAQDLLVWLYANAVHDASKFLHQRLIAYNAYACGQPDLSQSNWAL